jgi:hypothetical protein
MDIKTNVEKQIENPDWDKINALAKTKKADIGDLLSEEGSLHIAVKEIYPEYNPVPIKMSGTEIKGRIVNKSQPRIIEIKGSKKTIMDVFVATEEMGVLKATLWGKTQINHFNDVKHEDAILLRSVKVSTKNDETVLNFFDNSEIEKLSDDDVKSFIEMLKEIEVETVKTSMVGRINGLIIVAEKREYQACPICGQRLSEAGGAFLCPTHQVVEAQNKEAMDLTIDRKDGVVQAVLWPELLEGGEWPDQFDTFSGVCRVYDANYFSREKAKRGGTEAELAEKQFPRQMRVTVYSYSLKKKEAAAATQKAGPTTPTDDKDKKDELVSVEDIAPEDPKK